MFDPGQISRQAFQTGGLEAYRDGGYGDVATQAKPVQTGAAMGLELAMIEDVYADLMDSMEELSAQFEEKTMKEVGQRKMGRTPNGKMAAYVKAVEKWTRHFNDLPSGEFIDRILKQLKQKDAAAMSPRDLLKALARGSGDPSHQFAMLDILEKALGDKEDAQLAKIVKEAKGELEKEKGAEVRAGINIAKEVNARAKTPEQMQDLRNLYRGETLGFKSPQDCFRSLLANRGAARLADSLDFLVKSCGLDLQNPSPSQSPEELRRIILDLQCVNVLKAMMEKCDTLVGKLPTLFNETSLLNGQQLAGKVTDLTEMPFPSAEDFASLLASVGLAQLAAKIFFDTQMMELLRALSPRLFAEDGDRFKLLDAAQENLDGLVKEEEAEEKRKREGKENAA